MKSLKSLSLVFMLLLVGSASAFGQSNNRNVSVARQQQLTAAEKLTKLITARNARTHYQYLDVRRDGVSLAARGLNKTQVEQIFRAIKKEVEEIRRQHESEVPFNFAVLKLAGQSWKLAIEAAHSTGFAAADTVELAVNALEQLVHKGNAYWIFKEYFKEIIWKISDYIATASSANFNDANQKRLAKKMVNQGQSSLAIYIFEKHAFNEFGRKIRGATLNEDAVFTALEPFRKNTSKAERSLDARSYNARYLNWDDPYSPEVLELDIQIRRILPLLSQQKQSAKAKRKATCNDIVGSVEEE